MKNGGKKNRDGKALRSAKRGSMAAGDVQHSAKVSVKPKATALPETALKRPAAPAGKLAAKKTVAEKKNTSEENRGGHFFSAIKMWRLLHTGGGTTIFNKEELARRYFKGIENDEAPEPELHAADLEDEFDDGLHEPLDDDLEEQLADDWDDDVFYDGPPGASAAKNSTKGKTSSRPSSSPYPWIKERHKRYVQRTIEKLKNYGIGIEDTDEHGNVLDEEDLKKRKEDNPRAERWWRYDPHVLQQIAKGHEGQQFAAVDAVGVEEQVELLRPFAMRVVTPPPLGPGVILLALLQVFFIEDVAMFVGVFNANSVILELLDRSLYIPLVPFLDPWVGGR